MELTTKVRKLLQKRGIVNNVEEKEESRFQDHSCSTPWESFGSDIQSALKEWTCNRNGTTTSECCRLNYEGLNFIFSLYDCSAISEMRNWFGVERLALLARGKVSEWSAITPSIRHSVFSALVHGLTGSGITGLPVFFTSATIERLYKSSHILGYELFRESPRSLLLGIHFDSEILDGVDSQHDLFYLDGNTCFFLDRLRYFLLQGNRSFSMDNALPHKVYVTVVEHFSFRFDRFQTLSCLTSDASSKDHTTPQDNMHDTEQRGDLPQMKKKDSCVHTNMDGDAKKICNEDSDVQHDPNDTDLAYKDEYMAELPVMNRTPMKCKIICGPSKATEHIRFAFQKFIHHYDATRLDDFTIRLCYEGLQSSTIDNINISTLIPSRQSPNAWNMRATFKTEEERTLQDNEGKRGQLLPYASPIATIIRRLLALFIFGKSSPDGLPLSRLSVKNRQVILEEYKFNTEMVDNATMVLSPESRAFVVEVCSMKASEADPETFDVYSKNLMEDCDLWMKTIFSDDESTDSLMFRSLHAEKCEKDDDERAIMSVVTDIPKLEIKSKQCTHDTSFIDRDDRILLPRSISAGFLASLCALYMGSMDGGIFSMSQLWLSFTSELRDRLERGVSLPHMELGCDFVESLNSDDDKKDDYGMHIPLWRRSLWDDAIQKKRLEGWTIYLPDTLKDAPPIIERLQLIQFCIAFKNVDTSVACPPDKHSIFDSCPQTLDTQDSTRDETLACRLNGLAKAPRLQRRLPTTKDSLAELAYISKKFSSFPKSGGSNSVGSDSRDNQKSLLRWQVLMPGLVSDMRSFKAENPEANVMTFREWYCGGELPEIDDEELQQLWIECESSFPHDQKPLFRAEKEAEKSLGCLENITTTQLAAEMLLITMMTASYLLQHKFQMWCDQSYFEESLSSSLYEGENSDTQFCLRSTWSALQEHTSLVVSLLKDESKRSMERLGEKKNTEPPRRQHEDQKDQHYDDPQVSSNIPGHILLLVDAIAKLVERLDEIDRRAQELISILRFERPLNKETSRFILSLCTGKSTAANTWQQAIAIRKLASKISKGRGHNRHSLNGRELGSPTKKEFVVENENARLHSVIDSNRRLRVSFRVAEAGNDY